MNQALDLCDRAADAVAMVDLRVAPSEELALGALGLQRHLDRMKALHAKVVAAADRAGVWQGSGARNMADWLAGKTNTSYGDAVSRLKLADSFARSPELAEAVEKGEVSAATAEAIHDAIANPPNGADVGELVDAVKGAGPRDAKAAAERWREVNATETEEEAEERRHLKRSVRSAAPVDGMVVTTVTLPTLQSRQVANVISQVAGKPSEGDNRTTEQRLADGLVQLCVAYAKGAVVGGREKPTILITIDVDSFTGAANEPGVTANGDRIPAHIVRHLAEQANLQRILIAGSVILDLGREIRYASESQYRALLVRDGGCRWPGCHIPAAWCEVDHLLAWEHGGPTDLDNLCCGAAITIMRSIAPAWPSSATHTTCNFGSRTARPFSVHGKIEQRRRRPERSPASPTDRRPSAPHTTAPCRGTTRFQGRSAKAVEHVGGDPLHLDVSLAEAVRPIGAAGRDHRPSTR